MRIPAVFLAIGIWAAWTVSQTLAADMKAYQEHIAKYHRYLDQAEQQRSKGKTKEAQKTAEKADKEKALADVALNSPARLPRVNEPQPIVWYNRPYYDYWGPYYRRGPWWDYPYRHR